MRKKKTKKSEWNAYRSDCVWEALMIAMILPAIVYSALSLASPPIG